MCIDFRGICPRLRSDLGDGGGLRRRGGLRLSVLGQVGSQVGQDGRQTDREHFGADRAEDLGHEETSDAGKAGVLKGESCPVGPRLYPVGDDGGTAVFLASPGIAKEGRGLDLGSQI